MLRAAKSQQRPDFCCAVIPRVFNFYRKGTLEAGTGSGNISQFGHVRLGQGLMEDLGLPVRVIRGAELG